MFIVLGKPKIWVTGATVLLLIGVAAGWPLLSRAGTQHHKSTKDPVLAETSKDCGQCHDGALAHDAFDPRSNHPIGIDYRSRLAQSFGRLNPIESVLRLEDGKVGCVTCHNLDSDLPGKLAISNDGSRLCFTCHNL